MSDNAIPITATSDVTRLYFDGGSVFGRPHAKPSTTVAPDRTWDDEQLLDAAHVGRAGRDLHPDLLAALCARYVDMAQTGLDLQTATVRAETAERRLAVAQGVAAGLQASLNVERRARRHADDLYEAELAERNRVAALHAEVSDHAAWLQRQVAQLAAEALHLRHELAGTTPVSVTIAMDRARAVTGAELAEQTLRFPVQVEEDGDAVVVDLEDLYQGVEVCRG